MPAVAELADRAVSIAPTRRHTHPEDAGCQRRSHAAIGFDIAESKAAIAKKAGEGARPDTEPSVAAVSVTRAELRYVLCSCAGNR
jgi:hypothetical protein